MTKKENVRSNDIKIEQIIINLDTSIPIDIKKEPDPNNEESSSKNEESETRIIKLTSNVLYHPKLKKMIGLSLYPYITSSIKFPVNYLKNVLSNDLNDPNNDAKPNTLDYNKIVQFFFDRNFFKMHMNRFSKEFSSQQEKKAKENAKILLNESKKEEENIKNISIDDRAKKEKGDILKFNIQYMLQLLFPTKFPTSNNFSFSFDEYIEGTMVETPNFVPIDYSYLKIDDKIYTIIKVTVLNDIINNPLYREIIEIYNNFTVKNEQISKKNVQDINKLKMSLFYRMNETNKNNSDYLNLINSFKTFSFNNEFSKGFLVFNDGKTEGIKGIIDGNGKNFDKIEIKIDDFNNIVPDDKNIDSKTRKELKLLYDNYKILYNNISEIYDILAKNEKNEKIDELFMNGIQKISELLEGIKKSLSIVEKNESITNEKPIIKITDTLIESFNKLNDMIKINIEFNGKNPKINLDKQGASIKEAIAKNNPVFNTFVGKIKNIIENHKTNNDELFQILKNFYNSKNENDIKQFNDLNKNIITELLNNSSKKRFFEKRENRNKINTGIHYINSNNDNLPHYEIFVAVDLFEGEINDKNVNKCNYRAYYLGQESENIFDGLNYIYDINYHRLFVPMGFDTEVIKDFKKPPGELNKEIEIESAEGSLTKKGGRKYTVRKILKRNKKKQFHKTFKKGRCSRFEKLWSF